VQYIVATGFLPGAAALGATEGSSPWPPPHAVPSASFSRNSLVASAKKSSSAKAAIRWLSLWVAVRIRVKDTQMDSAKDRFSGAEDRVKMARILLICSWPQEPGNNGSLHARRFRTTSLTSRKPLEFLFDGCGERTGKSRRILSEGGDPGMNQEQGAMPAVVNPTLSEMRKECSENPYTHAAAFIRHS
jgi:hypothetical protein